MARDECATYDIASLDEAFRDKRVEGYNVRDYRYNHWLVVKGRRVVEGHAQQGQALDAMAKLKAHDELHGLDTAGYAVVLRVHDYQQVQSVLCERRRRAAKGQ